MEQGTAPRRLGAVAAHHIVLLGRQQLLPFCLGAGERKLQGCHGRPQRYSAGVTATLISGALAPLICTVNEADPTANSTVLRIPGQSSAPLNLPDFA
jgi:hypothetical protein